MDHGFSRAKEAWELTDGAIFMLKEASAFEDMREFTIATTLQRLLLDSMAELRLCDLRLAPHESNAINLRPLNRPILEFRIV